MVNLMLLSMPPWSRTLHMSHQKLLLQFSFCCPLFSLCFVFLLSFVLLFSFVFLDYILAPFYAVYNRQYLAVVQFKLHRTGNVQFILHKALQLLYLFSFVPPLRRACPSHIGLSRQRLSCRSGLSLCDSGTRVEPCCANHGKSAFVVVYLSSNCGYSLGSVFSQTLFLNSTTFSG